MINQKNWLVKHCSTLKSGVRIAFGLVWLIDGLLKFQPDMPSVFSQLIAQAEQGQPAWLMPWFNFWSNLVRVNPAFFVYLIGTLEVALAISLIFGAARKLAYTGGMALSLLIWSVPEGFGGPYGPSSTDIGTGIIYSFVFLLLLIINATYGTSRYSADYLIEQKIAWWKRVAEAT
jgi:uncharacterized membrane protein YphA (DoxX/SURF4 family)